MSEIWLSIISLMLSDKEKEEKEKNRRNRNNILNLYFNCVASFNIFILSQLISIFFFLSHWWNRVQKRREQNHSGKSSEKFLFYDYLTCNWRETTKKSLSRTKNKEKNKIKSKIKKKIHLIHTSLRLTQPIFRDFFICWLILLRTWTHTHIWMDQRMSEKQLILSALNMY